VPRSVRDYGASLRLMANALRLVDFTIHDLAEASQAKYETAEEFVKQRRDSGVLDSVDKAEFLQAHQTHVEHSPQRFRISDVRRQTATQKLVDIRRNLLQTSDEITDSQEAADFMGPLAMAERTLAALRRADSWTDSSRNARLEEARILIRVAQADIKSMATSGGITDRILELSQRCGAVQQRLEEFEAPFDTTDPWRGLVDNLVNRLGRWTGAVASARYVKTFVILLDGISERDPISSEVVRWCTNEAVPVAAFDVAKFQTKDWSELYKGLLDIHVAKPSAFGEVVITVNGSKPSGRRVAQSMMKMNFSAIAPRFREAVVFRRAYFADNQHFKSGMFCVDISGNSEFGPAFTNAGFHYINTGGRTLSLTHSEAIDEPQNFNIEGRTFG